MNVDEVRGARFEQGWLQRNWRPQPNDVVQTPLALRSPRGGSFSERRRTSLPIICELLRADGNFNEALQVPRFQYNQCARRRVRSAVDGPFVQANRCYRECLRMDKLYMQRSTERLPRQTQQSESSLNIIRRRLETAAKTRAHGSQISNCYRTDPDGLLSGPPVIFPLQIRPDCSSAAAPESLEGQPARRANASWEQERGNNGSLHARRFRTAFANWSQPPAALLVLLFR
jgi:hypothetical protein